MEFHFSCPAQSQIRKTCIGKRPLFELDSVLGSPRRGLGSTRMEHSPQQREKGRNVWVVHWQRNQKLDKRIVVINVPPRLQSAADATGHRGKNVVGPLEYQYLMARQTLWQLLSGKSHSMELTPFLGLDA